VRSTSAAHLWRRTVSTRADSAAKSTPTNASSRKCGLPHRFQMQTKPRARRSLEPNAVPTSRIAPRHPIALCSMDSPLRLTASLSTAQQSTAVSTLAIHPLPFHSPPVFLTCSLCPQSARHLRRRSTLHYSISARPYRHRGRLMVRQRHRKLAQQLARVVRGLGGMSLALPAHAEQRTANSEQR